MKRRCFIWTLVIVCLWLCGCGQPTQSNWLLLNFEETVPVTYHFVSDRQITIDLTSGSSGRTAEPQTISEKLDMVVTYTPVEVDPFGLTNLVAECRSAEVTRSSLSGRAAARDAMENMAGKSFHFSLSPTGEITDDADIRRVLSEVSETAFAQSDSRRIKNPDMIADFIAMQWHLWDATSTIEEPLTGMRPGQTWQVRQWIPWPSPIRNVPMRLTTYTLDSFVQEEDLPRKAVIKSEYRLAGPVDTIPFPWLYEGSFQMRGVMGFLRNYRFNSLEGEGAQIFNMADGLIESDKQQYTLNVNASFLLPLGDSVPVLTVHQTIEIEQIETP